MLVTDFHDGNWRRGPPPNYTSTLCFDDLILLEIKPAHKVAHKGIYLIEWLFRSQSYWGTVLIFVGILRSYSVNEPVALAETWTTKPIRGSVIQCGHYH